MPDLYPLILRPQFRERVWGSCDLAPIYSHEITGSPIGEAWLTGDDCQVANGTFAGHTLAELAEELGAQLLGVSAAKDRRFPLLIKFLFPKDKLSVQVHPDDESAARAGEPCGKTECWYVLSAEPGAQIALGLKPGTGKTDVECAIREARLEQLLNWITIRAGEMYYVEAGTIHAIGPGSVIVETQQNSDTTYRLYDYGRPRELHIAAGLRAAKEATRAGKVLIGQAENVGGKRQQNLITSPCFIVDKFQLARAWQFQRPQHLRRSVWCLVVLRGYGILEYEGLPPQVFSAGEALVVPAAVDRFILKPQWELEFLCSSLPVENVGHPATIPVNQGWEQQAPAQVEHRRLCE
ncbi:MAG TPA: type I phosphomannose isomerase catalytic subunit [Candidatus Angelobacter sp.]|nr:type I phosphomannose isomerase catalytic subunit [Candidatus Angelobacter sp.]